MNEVTTTKPLEYITFGDIVYKVTPYKNNKHIQVVADFNKFLEKVPIEIYDEAVKEMSKSFNIKEFGNLLESDFIFDVVPLQKYIIIFKQIILEYILKNIVSLCILQEDIKADLGIQLEADHSLKTRINNVMTDAYNIVKECEEKHLTDTQEFINFENALNYLSNIEHPEWEHDFKAESHIEN